MVKKSVFAVSNRLLWLCTADTGAIVFLKDIVEIQIQKTLSVKNGGEVVDEIAMKYPICMIFLVDLANGAPVIVQASRTSTDYEYMIQRYRKLFTN